MTNIQDTIERLEVELSDYQVKVVRIENKICNPDGLSDYQLNMLKVQKNALDVLIDIIESRMKDLKKEKKRINKLM